MNMEPSCFVLSCTANVDALILRAVERSKAKIHLTAGQARFHSRRRQQTSNVQEILASTEHLNLAVINLP